MPSAGPALALHLLLVASAPAVAQDQVASRHDEAYKVATSKPVLYGWVAEFLAAYPDSRYADELEHLLASFRETTLEEPALIRFQDIGWTVMSGEQIAGTRIPGLHVQGRQGEVVARTIIIASLDARIPGVADDLAARGVQVQPVGTLGSDFRIVHTTYDMHKLMVRDAARVTAEADGVFLFGVGTVVLPVGTRFHITNVLWGGRGGHEVKSGHVLITPDGLELQPGAVVYQRAAP